MAGTKVLIGLSGGVDSSVAAALLVEQGFNVIGVTLKLYDYADLGFSPPDGGCCTIDLIQDARTVCSRLGIPHYVIDLTEPFRRDVMDDFVENYSRGRTPNPCVNCNSRIKWGEMLVLADKLSCSNIATGHYARIDHSVNPPRLLRAKDSSRDQSYALWAVSQAAVSRTLFPVGELTKSEVRQIARKLELPNSGRPDSQEICFVPAKDYSHLVRSRLGAGDPSLKPGPIFDSEGVYLGQHKGYVNYTIGQRKGLGVSSKEPLYVIRINPDESSITVGTRNKLTATRFLSSSLNLFIDRADFPEKIQAQIRYRHQAAQARIAFQGHSALVTFDTAQSAITPGQSAVFYHDDRVLGGGIIEQANA